MRNVTQTWNEIVYHFDGQPLGINALKGLAENKYAAIVLKNVLDKETLNKSIEIVQRNYQKVTVTQYCNGSLTTIGPYLAKYLDRTDEYFQQAEVNESLFPASLNLPEMVRQKLKYIFGLQSLEVGGERDGRRYAPFVVRIHADGVMNPLHNDNIMRDAASTGISLGQLTYQLSCIVCLQECDEGGHLRHYQKQWSAEDEQYKIENGIGYDYGVVKGKPCFVFKPQMGDIYLINPTNYHEVDRVGGKTRLTLGFFIGFFDRDFREALVWS